MQYVDDLVEGVFKLMRRPEVHLVDIGNPIEYTVKEFAALILELSGSASELMHKPLPQDDPKQRCPEITRSREVLGWDPRDFAREGLLRTINWFAKRIERESRLEIGSTTG